MTRMTIIVVLNIKITMVNVHNGSEPFLRLLFCPLWHGVFTKDKIRIFNQGCKLQLDQVVWKCKRQLGGT